MEDISNHFDQLIFKPAASFLLIYIIDNDLLDQSTGLNLDREVSKVVTD